MKFNMHVKNIRDMKFNSKILKIHTQKRNIWKIWRVSFQTNLERNFVLYVALSAGTHPNDYWYYEY